jgi:hypothetical protein
VYRSPFNPQEKTASFFVFKNHEGEYHNFKDYSSGLGGDVYLFLMEYHNINFVEAKKKLKELIGIDPPKNKTPNNFSFKQQKKSSIPLYEIISVREVTSSSTLISYLHKRCISDETISKVNLSNINYKLHGKQYYAIGFKNNSGGWEVRNKYFKGNLLKKDLTTVITGATSIKVFEGFMDYLSYLELAPTAPQCDYMILNSTSLINSAIEVLRGSYRLIELYFDMDKAGQAATEKIRESITDKKIIDKRPHYVFAKDLNEFLINRKEALHDEH